MTVLIVRAVAALAAAAIFFVLFAVRSRPPGPGAARLAEMPGEKMLIFSRTAGYRHGCIPRGNALLYGLAGELGLVPVVTENAEVFTPEALGSVRLVVFNNTSGDVLNAAQEAAFEEWFGRGGAFAGIHAAADTEYGWTLYGELLGAYFKKHPKVQEATLHVVDAAHPSTAHLPAAWVRRDEWYDFRAAPPAESTRLLLRLDEGSYRGGTMGENHPISWCREVRGGRVWYTGLGHTEETYAEPDFRRHLRGGLAWALGREEEDGSGP
jgi:type 1 glutamine amidotransferase